MGRFPWRRSTSCADAAARELNSLLDELHPQLAQWNVIPGIAAHQMLALLDANQIGRVVIV
jgi:hypothetical protein